MSVQEITCTICGYRFNPSGQAACQGCPLQKGCQLVCCPACGYEMVDIQQSRLARWAARWLKAPQAAAAPQGERSISNRGEAR